MPPQKVKITEADIENMIKSLTSYQNSLEKANKNVHGGSFEFQNLMDSVDDALFRLGNIVSDNKELQKDFDSKESTDQTKQEFAEYIENRKIAIVETALKKIREAAVLYSDKKYSENKEYDVKSKSRQRIDAALDLYNYVNGIIKMNPENHVEEYVKPDNNVVNEWFEQFKKVLTDQGIALDNPISLANVCVMPDTSDFEIKKLGRDAYEKFASAYANTFEDVMRECGKSESPAFLGKEQKQFEGYFMQEGNIYENCVEKVKTAAALDQTEINHLYRMYQQGRIYLRPLKHGGDAIRDVKFILPDKDHNCIVMPTFSEFQKKDIDRDEPVKMSKEQYEKSLNLTEDQLRDYVQKADRLVSFSFLNISNVSGYLSFVTKFLNKLVDFKDRLDHDNFKNDEERQYVKNFYRDEKDNIYETSDVFNKRKLTQDRYRMILNIAALNPDWVNSKKKLDTLNNILDIYMIPKKNRTQKQQNFIENHLEFDSYFIDAELEFIKKSGYGSLSEIMQKADIRDESGKLLFKDLPQNSNEFMNKVYLKLRSGNSGQCIYMDGRKYNFNDAGYLEKTESSKVAKDYYGKVIKACAPGIAANFKVMKSLEKLQNVIPDNGWIRINSVLKEENITDIVNETFNETIKEYSQLLTKLTNIHGSSNAYKDVEKCLKVYENVAANMTPDQRAEVLNNIRTKYISGYLEKKASADLSNKYTARRVNAMKNLDKELKDIVDALTGIEGIRKSGVLSAPSLKKKVNIINNKQMHINNEQMHINNEQTLVKSV